MSSHHEFSPSSLERRMLCPASFNLEQSLPPNADSDDAVEGSLLHDAVATGNFSKLDAEQIELAEECRKFADDVTGGDWLAEQPLRLFDRDFSVLTEGTADVVKIIDDKGIIIDWKFGRNPVEYAADNIQLAAYACALMTTKRLKECTVYMVQPRLHLKSDFTFTDAESIRNSIRDIINGCKADNPTYCPGGKQCRYCKGALQGGCPALMDSALLLATEPLVTETEEVIKRVSGEQLTAFMLASAPISKAREAVKAELKARCMMNDGSYSTWMIKPGNKQISCQNINDLHNATADIIDMESYLKYCSVKAAKVRDLYAERLKAQGEVKTLTKGVEKFFEKAGHLITYTRNKPELVRVPDAGGAETLPYAEGASLSAEVVPNVGDTVDTCQA